MSKFHPKVYITLDTDWCPEEILHYALDLLREHNLRCTIFATGRYAALDNCDPASVEIGLHPNFNKVPPSHYQAQLRELIALYPQAQGVSSHAMLCSTPLLELFKRCDLKYDRNLLLYKQPHTAPFAHYNGLLRVPIFWEDDIWFTVEPGLAFSSNLLTNLVSRCVFNFHPIHLYMNTASTEHYASFKPHYHEPHKLSELRHHSYGAYSFFMDLIGYLRSKEIATGLLRELVSK